MNSGVQAILRTLLVTEYGSIKARLARRFGSMDFASEVVHELYLRLEAIDKSVSLHNPMAYLFRMALNIAMDNRKADNRLLTGVEIDGLRTQDQDQLDPARVAEARSDIESLTRALQELPSRQRDIFLAARLEEIPHRVLAKRFGVSERTIERELKSALVYCRKRISLDPWKAKPHLNHGIDTSPTAMTKPSEGSDQ